MTGERFSSQEGYRPNTLYLKDMLEQRGLGQDYKPEYLDNSGLAVYSLMKSFSDQSGYGLSSSFGQFAFLLISENYSKADLQGFINGKVSRKRAEPTAEVKEEIRARRSALTDIRTVRKEIGKKIFGDEHENYTNRVNEALIVNRGGDPRTKTGMKRDEVREQLYAEVRERFPLTSR